ncbi:MAG: aryl-sulfate sulfotransferase [Flavobacteriales bacterium]|nr:aryl-sulfate sulfotransferase [Flavobacteriales bacterium]
MKKLKMLSIIAGFLCLQATGQEDILYHSPLSSSFRHHINSRVVLRHNAAISNASIENATISLIGNISGSHEFEVLVGEGNTLINLVPESPFIQNEYVTVEVSGLETIGGASINPIGFGFGITTILPPDYINNEVEEESFLPETLPDFQVLNGPEPGLAPGNFFTYVKQGANAEVALLNFDASQVLWFDSEPSLGADFKLHPDGVASYASNDPHGWTQLDELGQPEDTVHLVNGYAADFHDYQQYTNGHQTLFAYDNQPVDMSQVVEGGDPDATVDGFVIQELTEDGLLFMQWRSWDYLEITDNIDNNLLICCIDPFHINSIELDVDSNYICSLRHTNEVLKISRQTGDIMWRWSHNPGINMVQFINDDGFSHQHDVRRLENGNILMFDNANTTTQITRIVEWSLDEENMTATLVWQYHHPENLFAASTGGCHRQPNGNTVIYWGNVGLDKYGARYSEIDAQGNTLLEIAFPIGWNGYRWKKYDFMFEDVVIGCLDETAFNYNPEATVNDQDLCQYDIDNDGYTPEMGDCDDGDDSINPGAVDIPYDGIDQDCMDGDLVDVDGDGFSGLEDDCNDNDNTIYPGADEIPYDGIDQDCADGDLVDVDGDGFSGLEDDCNDEDASINPDAEEIPYDGIDQDCVDGDLVDVDGDGYSGLDDDCNDNDSDINPDAEEIPNDGIDQDCNGSDLIVGVENLESNMSVFLSNGYLQIHELSGQSYRVEAYDAQGKCIINQGGLTGSHRFAVDSFAGSCYVVRIIFTDRMTVRKLGYNGR